MTGTEDRRSLFSRDAGWAKAVAERVALLTPSQVAQANMAAAAAACGAFLLAGYGSGTPRAVMLTLAALFCLLRMFCNLFDGAAVVEDGAGEDDRPFWTGFADRIADLLILVGVGFCIGMPSLGWAAAAFAMLTAYVRELGNANGLENDVSGPMAKPHRMAVITCAAVLSIFEPWWNGGDQVLTLALWVIVLGAALTALRRARTIVIELRSF